jgi:hypothetical protein
VQFVNVNLWPIYWLIRCGYIKCQAEEEHIREKQYATQDTSNGKPLRLLVHYLYDQFKVVVLNDNLTSLPGFVRGHTKLASLTLFRQTCAVSFLFIFITL